MKVAALSDVERLAWHRLSQSENVGPITFEQLLARFGTATEAIAALPELAQRGGMRRGIKLYARDQAEDDLARIEAMGARCVAMVEPAYPEWLRNIPAAPPLLCLKGDFSLLMRPMLAVVGARNASAAGMQFTRTLSAQLGEAGFVIVSGLARGIDTAAHEAAMTGGTIAVVAGGIDHIYPPENERLQRRIGESGLLVSENPPGIAPKAEHFPRRNRIIAGLARATIVVEAAMRSGSLITARFANEQGRDVFAVPGSPLDPRCEGTNKLIKEGAHMLTSLQDVLDVVPSAVYSKAHELREPEIAPATTATQDVRSRVTALLSPTPVGIDDLIRESGAEAEAVLGVVLELELAGRAVRGRGGMVSLNSA